MQVELREDMAAKKAEIVHLKSSVEQAGTNLAQAQGQHAECATQLHAADVRNSQLTAQLGQLQRDLVKEQQELADAQVKLGSTQDELGKAKHWNDIQVRRCASLCTAGLVCAVAVLANLAQCTHRNVHTCLLEDIARGCVVCLPVSAVPVHIVCNMQRTLHMKWSACRMLAAAM